MLALQVDKTCASNRFQFITMKRILFLFLFAFVLSFSLHAQSDEAQIAPISKVRVFPNPATDVVIVLGLQNSGRAEVIVTDIYGNMVLKHQGIIKDQALNIPIASLGTGIYVIAIRTEVQDVRTKFYKQ